MRWRSLSRVSKTGSNGGQQPRPSPPLPSYSLNVSDALRSGRAIGSEQDTIITKVLYTRRGSAKSIPFGSTLTIASSWQCGSMQDFDASVSIDGGLQTILHCLTERLLNERKVNGVIQMVFVPSSVAAISEVSFDL